MVTKKKKQKQEQIMQKMSVLIWRPKQVTTTILNFKGAREIQSDHRPRRQLEVFGE